MVLSGGIRVKTSRRYKTLYTQLKNHAVKDMHELFFMTACLGYRNKAKKPLGSEGEPRFWSNTITPEEYASFYAMTIEESEMDFDAISDDEKVIRSMEEYSNAGMDILIRDLLADYTITSNGELSLDPATSNELPKVLLAFLHKQASD
jgi:hypothetical protein